MSPRLWILSEVYDAINRIRVATAYGGTVMSCDNAGAGNGTTRQKFPPETCRDGHTMPHRLNDRG
jgi:hypothetical protein